MKPVALSTDAEGLHRNMDVLMYSTDADKIKEQVNENTLMLLKINLKKKIKKYYKMPLSQVVILMSLPYNKINQSTIRKML